MKHLIIFAACSLLSFPVSLALAAPAQVPQTGQSFCYDTVGAIIACTGTGQDGELQAGVAWPSPRFTDNSDETITDNLTGLIWTKNANPAGSINWQDALDFIKTMNSESYKGYNDWRLPNRNELESMINKGQIDPAGWLSTQGFSGVQGINKYGWSYYWSSSSYYWGAHTSSAWYIFMDGSVSNNNKGNDSFVWPVRSGQPGYLDLAKTGQDNCYNSAGATTDCVGTGQDGELQSGMDWPAPRFKDNGDQTMTDYLTGLIWSKDANIADALNWQDALEFIKARNSSNYLGHNDWRLPNSNELESLVNKGHESPADWLDTQGLVNVQPDYYWSSSTYVNDTTKAWFVNMTDGYVNGDNKSNLNYLWPVREVQALRDGILSTAPGKTLPNIIDAQRALMIVIGLIVPTPEDLSHGDIAPLNANGTPKGNDEIDFYDVIAILRKIIDL